MKERVDSILGEIEEDIQNERATSGPERIFSMAGSSTAPVSLNGPPYY
ncbi:MAG TPA: hypothetical protein VGA86_08110 [Desulfatiglandales bacterium]